MGLGYPDIASIHPANYTAASALQLLGDRLLYDTLFVRMMKQGVAPYFAMALERTPLEQEIGFGKSPPLMLNPVSCADVTRRLSFIRHTSTRGSWRLRDDPS